LSSQDPLEVIQAVADVGWYASRRQARWALDVLVRFAIHPDNRVRVQALGGLGELARRYAVSDDRAVVRLEAALQEPSSPGVQAAARKSLDEIRRFAKRR
jgi:hypothetical protein